MISLLELFFSCCRVVAVAKENLLETPAIISFANFQRIQMLRCPRLAFDWLFVSFFYYWPIRMSGLLLLLLCAELTFLCTELPENCIYLNQPELNNFFIYIIRNSNEAPSWSWGKIEELKKFPHNQVVNKNKFSLFPSLSLPPISPSLSPPSLSPSLSPLSLPPLSPSLSLPLSLPPSPSPSLSR